MNAFLDSLREDLLDRRMRPLLALLSLALVGALAYAVLGGSGSGEGSPAPSSTAPSSPLGAAGISLKQTSTSAVQPVAETTSGAPLQRGGVTRNPFAPLPGSETSASPASSKAAPSTSSSSSSSSKSSESGGGGSSSAGGSSGESGKSTPEAKKPSHQHNGSQTVYHVAVLFGTATPGAPATSAQLTPYENLKRQQPLPSTGQPLVVFRGVVAGGKSATFTLVGEAILRGNGTCVPSASQCEAIDLKVGQTEELEYTPQGGPAVTYQLQVASITSNKASASAARRAFAAQSLAGARLLHEAGLVALPGMRYSQASGVLVPATRHAFRAHASLHRAHASRHRAHQGR